MTTRPLCLVRPREYFVQLELNKVLTRGYLGKRVEFGSHVVNTSNLSLATTTERAKIDDEGRKVLSRAAFTLEPLVGSVASDEDIRYV